MIDLKTLTERLVSWSQKWSQELSHPPILLYQALFRLIHDLKSSIHVSSDPQITAQIGSVEHIDKVLHLLAFGFAKPTDQDLATIKHAACKLTTLEDLEQKIQELEPRLSRCKPENVPSTKNLFSLDYSWDGLARARAAAAIEINCVFFHRSDIVVLSSLNQLEKMIETELKSSGAFLVAHKLTPQPTATQKSTQGDLNLGAHTLAAFPTNTAPSTPWQEIKL